MTPTQIKTLRQSKQMSIEDLAQYLAVDSRTVRRYEDGTRIPGGPVIKLLGLLKSNTAVSSR